MNQDLIHKLLRYLTQGAVIYLLFKYVPTTPMKDSDILIITAIILLVYIIAENCYQMYFGGNKQSSCGCNAKEGFDNNLINNSLSQIGSSSQAGSSYDVSSINSALSQISSEPSQPVVQNTAQNTENQNAAALLQKTKMQSELAFKQGQQQMQQAQSQLFGQSVQDMQKQVQQVANSAPTIPAQAPQVSFPVTSELPNVSGYSKNADGTFTITAINPISQVPFASNYTDYNTIPVSSGQGTFEFGYSFLPPSNWYPTPVVPPVCVMPQDRVCPVCPIYTEGTNMDLKEWNASLSVLPSEQINVKLN